MNLKDLQAIQQLNQNQRSRRSTQSDDYYNRGLTAFETSAQSHFEDANALLKACELFIRAVKSNRSDDRPALMLAYIFLVLEDFDNALQYLRPVLARNSKHVEALELKSSIQIQLEQKLQKNRALETPDENLDSLKRSILKAAYVGQSEARLQVAFHEKALQTIENKKQLLEQQLRVFRDQIASFEHIVETQSLYQTLRPLEVYVVKFNEVLQRSQAGLSLKLKLDTHIAELDQLCAQAQQGLDSERFANFENRYENIMDQSEIYDGQIARLCEGLTEDTVLDLTYRKLCRKIEDFADILDDFDAGL